MHKNTNQRLIRTNKKLAGLFRLNDLLGLDRQFDAQKPKTKLLRTQLELWPIQFKIIDASKTKNLVRFDK
uniref:Uncharacterized protein n=1 Tax=Romanomermis culicivorax TaxID=13658 RepID=A0A915I8J2_ROMCU